MNQKRKANLSPDEHLLLSGKFKRPLYEIFDCLSYISRRYPKNAKIYRLAQRSRKQLGALRSALDDDICSYPETLVPDAVEFYYGRPEDTESDSSWVDPET